MTTRPAVLGSSCSFGPLLAFALALAIAAGCERRLIIRQDAHINNAMHHNRPAQSRTGEPLEITLLLFLPEDYDKPGNEGLRPGQPITCKDWYERRPGSQAPNRFAIPEDQIYLLTDEPVIYGKKVADALHGSRLESDLSVVISDDFVQVGGRQVPIKRLDNPWDFKGHPFYSDKCAIYVFGRFSDEYGNILPVRPLMIRPRDMRSKEVIVLRVGVDNARYNREGNWGQVIDQSGG